MAAVRVTGLAAAEKAIANLDGRDRQNALRRGVRAAGKVFQADLKTVAAGADVPRSFQKVPAPRVTTHGGSTGREVEATVRPKSPLFNIFEPGAKGHDISPRGSRPAGFRVKGKRVLAVGARTQKAALGGPAGSGSWDSEGRKRPADFFARGTVHHPGMHARPILGAAFAMGEAAAADALSAVLFGTVKGTE